MKSQEIDQHRIRFEARLKDAGHILPEQFIRENGLLDHPILLAELHRVYSDHKLQDTKPLGDQNRYSGELPETTWEQNARGDEPFPADQRVNSDSMDGQRIRYFGDYELLSEVARGGMGVVYKARQVTLNRVVALKMILSGNLARKEEIKRFKLEAEAAAQLDHPSIVPIHEIGEHDGQHYFSMGYVDGGSLSGRLRKGPLSPDESASLLSQICDAVEYAHTMGVVHRDLKPSNVLLDGNGSPRVSDFGLAKRVDCDSELTKTGQAIGTPAYMPPEQAAGKIDEIGPHSDVYSLGAILYAMLTGRPPFHAATTFDTLRQVLQSEPVPPIQINSAVPTDLNTICLKCLNKDPIKRYESAQDLGEDLRRFLDRSPIKARSIGRIEFAYRLARRHPARTGLVFTLAISFLLAAGIGVGLPYQWKLSRTNESLSNALGREQTLGTRLKSSLADLRTARAAEELANERLEQILYYRRVSLAFAMWNNGHAARARQLLKDCPPDRRHWEWHYVHRLSNPELQTLRGHVGRVNSISFNHDGSRIVSGGSDGVRLWECATGAEVAVYEGHGAFVSSVLFSPDGKFIATAGEDGIVRIREEMSAAESIELKGHATSITSLAFSPDSQRIASACADGIISIWQTSTGKQLNRFEVYAHRIHDLKFAPEGNQIVISAGADRLEVRDARTGEIVRAIRDGASKIPIECYFFSLSPNGEYVSVCANDQDLRIWEFESGKPLRKIRRPHHGSPIQCAFSMDGRQIATVGRDHIARMFSVKYGNTTKAFRGHESTIVDVKFNPDGNQLATASWDGTIRLWSTEESGFWWGGHEGDVVCVSYSANSSEFATASGSTIRLWNSRVGKAPKRILEGHTDIVNDVDFAPNGYQLASGSKDQTIKLWNASSGKIDLTIDGRCGAINAVDFSPNGRWIASAGSESKVGVWDATTGENKWLHERHDGQVNGVAFSPDGSKLISCGDDDVAIIWNLESGNVDRKLEGHSERVMSVSYSPDGKSIATAGYDKSIRIWNAESGMVERTLVGHLGPAFSLSYSPDGKRLVSSSVGDIIVWDLDMGEIVLSIEDAAFFADHVEFAPDGKSIAAAMGGLRRVKVFDAR